MKICLYVLLLGFTACVACQDMTVGFLNTTYCEYLPDSLVIKKIPDEDSPQSYNHADWVSAPLQGFTGTAPIYITVEKVVSPDGGDVDIFLKEMVLRGNGAFVVPVENNIPKGRYVVSLRLKNEGYTSVLDSFFTVVVKE